MCDTFSKRPSVKQLLTVFKLCDPAFTGRVKIEYLLELAKSYITQEDHMQEISLVIKELDPTERGTLSFKEFSSGIREIVRKQRLQEETEEPCGRQSMMSPITTSSDSAMEIGGGADLDPSFVISPPDSPRRAEATKSQCSSLSDTDNYEWTGDGVDPDIDADSGISPDKNALDNVRTRSPSSNIHRHTWLRTSLRRSPPNHQDNLPNRRWGSFRQTNGKRQLGSNALASQLYRSSSFNSSGRSSTCDTADDMYSDASLEEDVHDLHHKFQVLQQQVGVLQDSAHQKDERYTRAKADNAAFQARIIMLEEQLRDTEIRSEDRLQDEQRRSKELLARLEREKQLQLENASIRLRSAETESANLKEEVTRQRTRIEKLETERKELAVQVQDLTIEVMGAREQANDGKEEERRLIQEHSAHKHLIEELSKEIERLRTEARTPALPTTSPEMLRLEELHEEMSTLRAKNTQLQEDKDELQARLLHAGLEQGKILTTATENSLAAELEAMTHDESTVPHECDSIAKMQQTLKEQQEVNLHLRCYIDGILLSIVENYPQLLEVKPRSDR